MDPPLTSQSPASSAATGRTSVQIVTMFMDNVDARRETRLGDGIHWRRLPPQLWEVTAL
jgi:hypothetical protein